MKGIDCTNQITEAIAAELKKQGYEFVCRYLVPQRLAWKRLTAIETEVMTKAGLKVLSVYETTADRPKLGAPAGMLDGREAKEEAAIVKQPIGTAIYFAVDYDAPTADYDKIEAYLRAAQAELTGYEVGVYGSYAIIEEMAKRKACKHFWQTYAWSYGKTSKLANVYQFKNGIKIAGITADDNLSFGNEGFWNYASKVIKEPTYEEIIKACVVDPAAWKKAIDASIALAKDKGNIGDLEPLQYFPELIMKVFRYGRDQK